MVYTLTLNPALDYLLKIDNLQSNDINRANDAFIYYGGKGINVSVILNRLGIDNVALGFVGGFTGEKLENLLKDDGINCDFVHLKKGDTRINVKIKAQDEIDINADGPNINDDEIAVLMKKLDDVKSGDYLVLAGSIPKNLPNNIYERIIKKLSNRGINFVVDATGDSLLKSLKYNPFLIKPNHLELGDLFDVKIGGDEGALIYAKKVQDMGARNVLVSQGKSGALLLDENGKSFKIHNVEGKVLNSVGCGDSMVAGFIAGFIKSGDYKEALILGAACANASAFSDRLAEVEEIKRVYRILKS